MREYRPALVSPRRRANVLRIRRWNKLMEQYGSLRNLPVMALRNIFLIDPQRKIAKVWTGVELSSTGSGMVSDSKLAVR